MTTRLVHRPTRVVYPPEAVPPLEVTPPPQLPEGRGISGMFAMLPIAGAMGSLTLMMFFRGSGFAALGAIVMVVVVLATAVMFLSQRGQAARQRRQHRERYLDYLERLREDLAEDERRHRDAKRKHSPAPHALLDLVRDPARRWERRRRDPDFLAVRVGSGTGPAREITLRDEGTPTSPTDPFLWAEAQALAYRFRTAPDLPLAVRLDRAGDVSLVGDRTELLNVVRALVCQTAALHAPEDVSIAVCYPPEHADDWSWLHWLPHLADDTQRDERGPLRRVAPSIDALADLLADDVTGRANRAAAARRFDAANRLSETAPRLLVICDAYGGTARSLPLPDRAAGLAELGITVIHLVHDRLCEPDDVTARVTVTGGHVTVEHLGRDEAEGVPDECTVGFAEGLARTLSPLRLTRESYDDGTGVAPVDAQQLLDVPDPTALDVPAMWRPRSERDFLRVPIGVATDGRPVLLDLKESAQLGMGPHGLCVGATGAGKSELLRTLVLALAASHPPDQLSLVLIDYKGGATFAPFEKLPHLAGLITNLVGDDALVERVQASLNGEVVRRQQVLADAGKVPDIATYELLRAERPELPKLGYLLVIIDEFGELLTAHPDMIELFLTIGRIGRSIGIHLLFASQRIEAGKLRQLDTHLSYRIGLRTLSEVESRTVLDTPDAFSLPPLPGYAYLKVDTSVYQKFRSAYVSGPLEDAETRTEPDQPRRRVALAGRYSWRPQEITTEAEPAAPARTAGATLLSTMVDQLATAAPPVKPVWLPPLPAKLPLGDLAGGVTRTDQGLRLREADGAMRVAIGLLDDPAAQWQGVWQIDLSAGHLLVVGGPGSGKSSLLRTLALSLAVTHTPREVAVYGIDLLGNGLRVLDGLPHVGGTASRDNGERIRRTVEEVTAMLEQRQALMRERGLDGADELRAAHAAGELPELPSADVVLLIDGYGQITNDFTEIESNIHALLARGAAYGVHVVATARRIGEVRISQQSAFALRTELRLTEPAESTINAKLARGVPDDTPGRALTSSQRYGHVALPILGGAEGADTVEASVRAVRDAWRGPTVPPVRVLPSLLPATELPDDPRRVAFGVDEATLSPVMLDLFDTDQHLLVLGDSRAGKTNLLKLVATTLMRHHDDSELVFAVFDPRRSLADLVPEPWLGGYATHTTPAASLAAAVAKELERRVTASASHTAKNTAGNGRPGPGGNGSHVGPNGGTVTRKGAQSSGNGPQAASTGSQHISDGAPGAVSDQRSPRVVVLIDDYETLAAAGTHPLAALAPYVVAGRDIGVHVVMTRRVLGAGRGLYEPFTLKVRESGCATLLMSGDRAEGQLFPGLRPSVLPPGRGTLLRQGEPHRVVQTAWLGTPEAAGRVPEGSIR